MPKPTKEDQRIADIVRQFIEDKRIRCSESIHQTDRVIEGAYEFIENLCEEAGYYIDEDDSE